MQLLGDSLPPGVVGAQSPAAAAQFRVSFEFTTMKTSNPLSFLLLFSGIFLMAFFGAEISRSLAPPESWAGQLGLPGYSLGLIVISASMFLRLTRQVRELQSKVQKLEKDSS
jgi:hypothetical protein